MQPNEYITTTEACEIIGVSKTVVKRLADEGILKTWKTPGGHRRLLRSSINDYIQEFNKPSSNEAEVSSQSHPNKRFKVMIVDDDPLTQQLISSIIQRLNLDIFIHVAKDGYEGLMMIGKIQPQIIFADLMMPNMDGYDMLKALRSNEETANTTIIVVTAVPQNEIDRTRLPEDVVVIHKPIQADIIRSFISYEYNLKSNNA
ncbi:response regulator [Hydrogenovibrio sp. JE_KL2]|uniref:response regulator n=1 Tax=Hydrogenovibrio sp. JE_KL2 TaxID=2651188 RepID=UPI00128E2C08|nr:response regulator [Hydrogenovibrio sp. JE_KL2]